jgi:hypothetical protein
MKARQTVKKMTKFEIIDGGSDKNDPPVFH